MNEDFRKRLKNIANFTPVIELPELSGDVEYKARTIINKMDIKYRNKIIGELQGDNTVIHVRENNYNGRKVIQFQARTSGCNMKKCGSCWNCNYGIKDKSTISVEDYVQEFERLINKYQGDTIVIESMGSVTDKKEFPREALMKIIDIVLKRGNFKSLTIETHITKIDEELVKYIYQKNSELPEGKRKFLNFEVGIEDFNPNNRRLINKLGVDNDKIKEVYNMLNKYGIELDINLIYGFPFQTEDERIEAMIENIRYANRNLPNAGIVVFLMSIKDNTIMQDMYNNGHYKLPNPWGFIEAAKKVIEEGTGAYIGFSWFGEKEDPIIRQKKAYCCNDCQNLIIHSIKDINKTFNIDKRKSILSELLKRAEGLECSHYKDFKEALEREKMVKKKSPQRRLHDYYSYLINNETGAKKEQEEQIEK